MVLSGVGTNGTSGAQAVKAAGGLCIAQDPDSADFGGMPSSLIQAGYADQVLKVADIPAVLLRYVQHPYLDPARSGQSSWNIYCARAGVAEAGIRHPAHAHQP